MNKMEAKLNSLECYQKMFKYLDRYWEKTKLDDLGGLLGSMDTNIFKDDNPADSGLLEDWETITNRRVDITSEECFEYMIKFIEKQSEWLDLAELVNHLKDVKKLKNQDWEEWITQAGASF